MSDEFDPYLKWMAIPKEEQPPNHYRLLGVPIFMTDPDVIENAADQRMVHVRTFQGGRHSENSQKILNEVSLAKVTLLNPEKKAAYDAQLKQNIASENAPTNIVAPPPTAAAPNLTPAAAPIAKPPAPMNPPAAMPAKPEVFDVAPAKRAGAARRGVRRTPLWQQPVVIGTVVGGTFLIGIVIVLATNLTFNLTLPPDSKEKLPPVETVTKSVPPRGGGRVNPGGGLNAAGQTINLLDYFDPAQDMIAGHWSRTSSGELQSDGTNWARVLLPVVARGSYKLHIKLSRRESHQSGTIIIPVGDTHCGFFLGGYENRQSGFKYLQEVEHIVESTRTYTLEIEVRLKRDDVSLAAALDGQRLAEWTGPISEVTFDPNWNIGQKGAFGLGTYLGSWRFEEVTLIMLDGKATPIRKRQGPRTSRI